MNKRQFTIIGLVSLFSLTIPSESPAQMIRFIALWEVAGDNATLDEWYRQTHSQEVLERTGPWLTRYWAYRSHRLGPNADRYNVTRYRVTEMWYPSLDARLEAAENMGVLSPAPPSQEEPRDKTLISRIFVPANPTERFVKFIPPRRERPYFRWLMVMRFPDSVSTEEADAWYTNVHAPELAKTPGVLRFVSHKAVSSPALNQSWTRYSELWFDSYDDWKSAFLDSALNFTKPAWGGVFPFADIISAFTADRPDMDFLEMKRRIP